MHVNIKGAGVSCDRVQAHISRVPHLDLSLTPVTALFFILSFRLPSLLGTITMAHN